MNKKSNLTLLVALLLTATLAILIWMHNRDRSVYLPFVSDTEQVWSSYIVDSLDIGPLQPMSIFIAKNDFVSSALGNVLNGNDDELSPVELLYRKSLNGQAKPVFIMQVENSKQLSLLYRSGESDSRKCWVLSLDRSNGEILVGSSGVGQGLVNFPLYAASACNSAGTKLDSKTVPKVGFTDFLWVKLMKCFGKCKLVNGVWVGNDLADDRVAKMSASIKQVFVQNEQDLGQAEEISISPNYVYLGKDYCALNYTVHGGSADGLVNLSSFRCNKDVSVLVAFSPQVFTEIIGE